MLKYRRVHRHTGLLVQEEGTPETSENMSFVFLRFSLKSLTPLSLDRPSRFRSAFGQHLVSRKAFGNPATNCLRKVAHRHRLKTSPCVLSKTLCFVCVCVFKYNSKNIQECKTSGIMFVHIGPCFCFW